LIAMSYEGSPHPLILTDSSRNATETQDADFYDDFYFCIPIFVFGQLKTITHTWVNVKLKVECHLHHEQQ
jgi:hypothetical protein